MVDVSYVAEANTGADSQQSSKSITKPAAVADGDVAVFHIVHWNNTTSLGTVTAAPAGAVLAATFQTGGSGNFVRSLVYVARCSSSDTTYQFTFSATLWGTMHVQFFRGVDPAHDLSGLPAGTATNSGLTFPDVALAAVLAGSALSWHGNTMNYGGSPTHTPPTGFTETSDVAGIGVAYMLGSAAGAVTVSGATETEGMTQIAAAVALPPATAAGPPHGTAAGTVTYAGAATGRKLAAGAATAAVLFATAAGGTAPAVGINSGTATAAASWAGAATGHAPTVGGAAGTASGTWTTQTAATGSRTSAATAAATATWTAAAVGSQEPPPPIPETLALTAVPDPLILAAVRAEHQLTAAPDSLTLTAVED